MSTIVIIVIALMIIFTIIILASQIEKYKRLLFNEHVARELYEKQTVTLQVRYKTLSDKYKALVGNNDDTMLDIMQNNTGSN